MCGVRATIIIVTMYRIQTARCTLAGHRRSLRRRHTSTVHSLAERIARRRRTALMLLLVLVQIQVKLLMIADRLHVMLMLLLVAV